SHIKLGGKSVWHKTREMAAIFDDARKRHITLTADLYPYTFWNSTIRVIITDRDFYNRAKVTQAIEENGGPEGIRLIRYSPDAAWVGKTLAEIAKQTGMPVEDVYMKAVRE